MYSNEHMDTATTKVGCVKSATEIIGDKWTPQLLRFFMNEDTVRFCQLQTLVGGVNPRTLSARLVHLEEQGIISKTNTSSSRCDYRLTQKGRDLMPILRGMQEWSDQYSN